MVIIWARKKIYAQQQGYGGSCPLVSKWRRVEEVVKICGRRFFNRGNNWEMGEVMLRYAMTWHERKKIGVNNPLKHFFLSRSNDHHHRLHIFFSLPRCHFHCYHSTFTYWPYTLCIKGKEKCISIFWCVKMRKNVQFRTVASKAEVRGHHVL